MKIEPPANPLTGVGASKATTDRTTAGAVNSDAAAAPAANTGGASVSTSALSSEMRALQEKLAASGTADIDVAKVEQIKAAIANGQLAIDTSKIADGLISTARDLLSAQSKS